MELCKTSKNFCCFRVFFFFFFLLLDPTRMAVRRVLHLARETAFHPQWPLRFSGDSHSAPLFGSAYVENSAKPKKKKKKQKQKLICFFLCSPASGTIGMDTDSLLQLSTNIAPVCQKLVEIYRADLLQRKNELKISNSEIEIMFPNIVALFNKSRDILSKFSSSSFKHQVRLVTKANKQKKIKKIKKPQKKPKKKKKPQKKPQKNHKKNHKNHKKITNKKKNKKKKNSRFVDFLGVVAVASILEAMPLFAPFIKLYFASMVVRKRRNNCPAFCPGSNNAINAHKRIWIGCWLRRFDVWISTRNLRWEFYTCDSKKE